MPLDFEEIAVQLMQFLAPSYPQIEIRVAALPSDPTRLALYFTDVAFTALYPQQRWHYLVNLIPLSFQIEHLEKAVWFEMAPGERPEDLKYPDDTIIESIASDVLRCLSGVHFFEALDDAMCPERPDIPKVECCGDFRVSQPLLMQRGFTQNDLFEICHVLMSRGAYCDCEILYNIFETSRLKAERVAANPPATDGVLPPDELDDLMLEEIAIPDDSE